MLLLALFAAPANAAAGLVVELHVEGRVRGNTVAGRIERTCTTDGEPGPCPASFAWVDPLASLPDPASATDSLRTFPGRPDRGVVRWEAASDGLTFEAQLPRRFGDIGWSGNRARPRVNANGGWYPQLLDAGRVVTAHWVVDVTVDDERSEAIVVVNGAVGQGAVHWEGDADRAALAVIPGGRIHQDRGSAVTIIDRPGPTPSSHRLGRRLLQASADSAGTGLPPVTVVQGPDLLHLARPAPGMVYLSDHAFRVLWLFRPYHALGIRQALIEATTPLPGGWDRAFVADAQARALGAVDLRKTLGWLTWNPVVDAILNDGSLPYYGDLFSEAFFDDPELLDRFEGRTPARAAARQLDDLLGPGAALSEANRLLAGGEDHVPAALRRGWLARYDPDQDYDLVIEQGAVQAVTRTAAPGAAAEVVTLSIDGQTTPWLTAAGADQLAVPDAKVVRIDPPGHVDESNRANNRWPARWDVILSGGAGGISPTQGNVDAWGELLLRPHGDTHNRGIGILDHDEQDLLGASIGYIYAFGPLLNRQVRSQRVIALVDGSWLDPAFRPTTSGFIAVGAYVGWTWETRLDSQALSGHRYALQVSGGLIPGSTDRWASAGASTTWLVELHPRHVVALRGKAGWASGDVAHRLLPLGGAADLRSVPTSRYLGNEKLIANAEYRWAVFRNAQVPLPLTWFSELQLAPGIEWGSTWANDGSSAMAVGGSLGIHTISDELGARPTLFGVTLAAPLWTRTVADPDPALQPLGDLQVYLDFSQGF